MLTSALKRDGVYIVSQGRDVAGNALQMAALEMPVARRLDASPICGLTRFIRICLFMCM